MVTRLSLKQPAGGLKFKSLSGQTKHSVADGTPRRDISSKAAVLPAGVINRRCAPQTRYTLWHNTLKAKNNQELILTKKPQALLSIIPVLKFGKIQQFCCP